MKALPLNCNQRAISWPRPCHHGSEPIMLLSSWCLHDNVAKQFDVVQHIVRLPISADIRGLRRSWWLAPHPSWSALATSAQAVAHLHICSSAHLHICSSTHLHIWSLHICTSLRLDFAVCSLHIWGAESEVCTWLASQAKWYVPKPNGISQAEWYFFPRPSVLYT